MADQALIIVDFQNDYFPGGLMELDGIEAAGRNGKAILDKFRAAGEPIFIVQHLFESAEAPFFRPDTQGAELHSDFAPIDGDRLIVKHKANSFQNTQLRQELEALGIPDVVICGAMSHMCIDATVRAAADFGFTCTVAHDACATCDQTFEGTQTPAKLVQASFMAALAFGYADIISTDALLTR